MSRIFTGAKAVIKLDSFPLLFVSSISINQENRLEEIPQLDDLLLAELAENGHRCSFTINSFKVYNNSAKDLGLDPLVPKDILLQPELIVEVYEELFLDAFGRPFEERVVYEMTGVKFSGGTGNIDARGVWVGAWNFKAKRGRGI